MRNPFLRTISLVVALLLAQETRAFETCVDLPTLVGVFAAFDNGDGSGLYERAGSTRFREAMPRATWVRQMRAFRARVGGTATRRTLIGSELIEGGAEGAACVVRFEARYTFGSIIEVWSFERENGAWRMAGLWLSDFSPHLR
ncbi:DUF4019 domain-containing protein [Salinarimonas sp.]|jgi:hypothetical protein|uniref:DUF4019 domain-containing protein n=1 Tax=Salinarimonas sp. TaxID=2766526 RepID=UPI0032D92CB5